MPRHLIFEYLPHKRQPHHALTLSDLSPPDEKPRDEPAPSSSSDCSAINMLLGRVPVRSSLSSTVAPTSTSVDWLSLLQHEKQRPASDNVHGNLQLSNIMDRLNDAIRQAKSSDLPERSEHSHRGIPVQA
jgi:hypothetical protein